MKMLRSKNHADELLIVSSSSKVKQFTLDYIYYNNHDIPKNTPCMSIEYPNHSKFMIIGLGISDFINDTRIIDVVDWIEISE